MATRAGIPDLTPKTIAALYAVVGGTWILLSDQLVGLLIVDPEAETYVQTAKGWLFVGISAVMVYLLVSYSRRELEETNERLDLALQQTSILHRILRHNLRNACNVIGGHARTLRAGGYEEETPEEATEIIVEKIDELIEITEKSQLLQDVVLADSVPTAAVDVAAVVDSQVEAVEDAYPAAAIDVSLPERATVETHPELETALAELLENAVVHNGGSSPTIRVAVATLPAGGVEIEIADDGPGMPEMERAVLEAGVERQTVHSLGLGLWLAETIVTQTGGEFRIDDGESGENGTVITVRLPPEPR